MESQSGGALVSFSVQCVHAQIIYDNNYGSDDGNVILKLFFLGPSTSICFLSNLFLTGPVLGSLQAHNQYPTFPPFFQRSLTISNPTTAINSCICVTDRYRELTTHGSGSTRKSSDVGTGRSCLCINSSIRPACQYSLSSLLTSLGRLADEVEYQTAADDVKVVQGVAGEWSLEKVLLEDLGVV